jgi:CXXX repeat peptide maturase
MFKQLLVILAKDAVPFCYYDNPHYYSAAGPELIPLKTLKSIVRDAGKNGIFINYIFGKHQLSSEYNDLIEKTDHVKIIPLCLKDIYEDGIPVLDADERDSFGGLSDDSQRNLILRVDKHNIAGLADLFESLLGKFKRLNIHLAGSNYFTDADFDAYEEELGKIGKSLCKQYAEGEEIEVNVLSDRLLLGKMNNCDAGVRHITIAPNGKYYICPGFYYDDENSFVGKFGEKQDPTIKNSQLLEIACAPICSRCDAFHCKRCVYLNKNTTLEINVPSKEQCMVSHVERDVSRQLLNNLGSLEPFRKMPPIPNLIYRDPFHTLMRSDRVHPSPAVAGTYGKAATDELISQVFDMQKKMLRILENK